ncbi:MAG: IS3 family transposase [Gammaproteobacteria bacterium]|nr:IS3 family transposase [Gammaproteobacteria bacterium]
MVLRKNLIESDHSELSINQQCHIVNVPRSNYYYQSIKKLTKQEQAWLVAMDRLYTSYPFLGYRKMMQVMQKEGHAITEKQTRRLMAELGIQGLMPVKQRRTYPGKKQHHIYPYLLNKDKILKPGDVWAIDITYIPMSGSHVYLVAVMDWYSRFILSWRVSNSMDVGFCIDALQEAIRHHHLPQIFNSDQGVQFTSKLFISLLKLHDIPISMDSKGRAFDNIMVERLWRSIKYELIYLAEYHTIRELKKLLNDYIEFYNFKRPHAGLNNLTPYEVYRGFDKP